MRFLPFFILIITLTACWPKSISFVDSGSMPEEWRFFYVHNIKNNLATPPINYAALLTDNIKDGIQNSTKLKLATSSDIAQIEITGEIKSYNITPIALQEGDDAAQNRLTVSAEFHLLINEPKEDEMILKSTRFIDYPSDTDLATVEGTLLEEVNQQIVQDIINKLQSNW